jgi:UDP-glucose 4-epimerase
MSVVAGKDVLVTGGETPLGSAIAAGLSDASDFDRVWCAHAAGASGVPPDSKRLRHVLLETAHPRSVRDVLLGEDLRNVRVLVHVPSPVVARDRRPDDVSPMVATTQLLLLAAEQHPHIARVVMLSSADVYRIESSEPMLIDEDHPLELSPKAAAAVRERVEADLVACARIGVSRLHVAVLRCSEILAPGVGGKLLDYLSSRVCLRPLGFDPMLNVLSLDDATAAVRLAAASSEPGVFNVPGADTLPLSELIHETGRLDVPVPGPALSSLYALRAVVTPFRFHYEPQRKLFHLGAILDGRRAQCVLGYSPAHRIDLRGLFRPRTT